MLNILSKKMKRQLLLLELLFEGETYRFQDLDSQLKCSSKTLRNDLMDIDSYAKEINIHTDRENGIFAEIAPHVTEEYIYRIIMNESIEYQFLEAIVLNKYTNYLEVTEQLFISESTLRRMVKRINLSLEQYHLRIRGLIRLTGNTQLIEKLTIQLLLEEYVCLEEAFNEEICQKSRQLYLKYITNNQLQDIIRKLEHRKHNQLLFYIAMKIYQVKNEKQFIEKEQNNLLCLESNEKQNTSLWLSLEEDQDLIKYIFEQPFVCSLLDIQNNSDDYQQKPYLTKMVGILLDYLEIKYQIKCEERQEICYKIINDGDYMENLSFILYDKHHQFLKQILPEIESIQVGLKNYLINKDQKELLKYMKNDEFTRKLVALLLVYWHDLLKKIETSKQIRALIVTNSEQYASYIIAKLELYLGGRYRFVASKTPVVTDQMLHKENYDCIVSNTMLNRQFNIPIFGISIYPKSREIQNLIFFYQQTRTEIT